MSKRTFGILASFVGSMIGAWWIMNQRRARSRAVAPARDHGTVIYDNTPTAGSADSIL